MHRITILKRLLIVIQTIFSLTPFPTTAGQTPLADTLFLADVRARAIERDPRSVQPTLLAEISRMNLANLRAQYLPQLAITGQASYQNEVPSLPAGTMGGFSPPLDQYRVQAEVDWVLYNGGRLNRESRAEQFRLEENLAGVAVTLDRLRDGATETFFAALFFQSRANTLTLAVEDIEARLALIRTRVEEGTALPSDAAALEAEAIVLRQQVDEAESNRKAALLVLSDLLDVEILDNTYLALPEMADELLSRALSWQTRPAPVSEKMETPALRLLENRKFRLQAEARTLSPNQLPQVSLFGQAGLGRPGPFNFLSRDLNDYSLIGLRLRWNILDWGQTRRRTRILQQQASITAHDYEATVRQTVRDVQDDQTDIAHIQNVLEADQRLISLREQVLSTSQVQMNEGVLLPAEYADRVSDLAAARLTEQSHRIELARARVRMLSTLGLFPDESTQFP